MAAQENHIDVVKYLLENGANQSTATEVSSPACGADARLGSSLPDEAGVWAGWGSGQRKGRRPGSRGVPLPSIAILSSSTVSLPAQPLCT